MSEAVCTADLRVVRVVPTRKLLRDNETGQYLGSAWRPLPPIMRMPVPLNHSTDRTWREAGELLDFNDRTGMMNTTAAELADLRAQLDRALRA